MQVSAQLGTQEPATRAEASYLKTGSPGGTVAKVKPAGCGHLRRSAGRTSQGELLLLTSELELLCRTPSLCYDLCSGVSHGRSTREGGDTAVQHATVSLWTPRSALGHSLTGCTTASLAAGMRSGHTSSSCILETSVGCLRKQQLAGGRDGQGVKRLVLLAPRLVQTLNALQCCRWCCANG